MSNLMFNILLRKFSTSFVLSLGFILFTDINDLKAEQIYPKYYIGEVEVVVATKPKILTQLTPCYIFIENTDSPKTSTVLGFENAYDQLQFSGLMTLPHLSKKEGDENGYVWISTGPTPTVLKEEKNKPGEFRYQILDPLKDPLINNLKASFDEDLNFQVVSTSYYHAAGRHFDVVHCKNLIEQTDEENINNFIDIFNTQFKPTINLNSELNLLDSLKTQKLDVSKD